MFDLPLIIVFFIGCTALIVFGLLALYRRFEGLLTRREINFVLREMVILRQENERLRKQLAAAYDNMFQGEPGYLPPGVRK